MQKKLILFGGSGFVGSNVAVRALLRGYKVIIATRQGVPPPGSPLESLHKRVGTVGGRKAALESLREGFLPDLPPSPLSSSGTDLNEGDALMALVEEANTTDALEFVSIDASSRPQVFQFFHDHPDTTSIVSCIGVLSRDYHHARAANADTNTNIAAGMCHPKLLPAANKFVYVSSEPYHKHLPFVFNRKITLKGYFHGKQGAEEGITKNLKHRGFILRPGFIYGTRYQSVPSLTTTGGGAALAMPLWMIGKPLDLLLSSVGGRKLLAPPCDVEVLAEAAVRACDWAFLGPEYELTGIADYYRMKEICQRTDPALTQKTQHKEEEEMNSETKEEKA